MRKIDRKYFATHFVNIILSTCLSATPVLIAAKRGIREMVKSILKQFPVAILDQDDDEKNIVLLAVEHRQVHVYKFMLNDVKTMRENVFGKVDKEGNSALHLAAMLSQSRPWSIPGAALQMQWETKWYKVTPSHPTHMGKVNRSKIKIEHK
jgi:ankyrin repeat protein